MGFEADRLPRAAMRVGYQAVFGTSSVGALRKRSCGTFLATSPREVNASAGAKHEPAPKGMVHKKYRNNRCGIFWCAIGDSNPGPTD